MDEIRFDNWSRALATRQSRRAVLQAATGGLLAAIGVRTAGAQVSQAQCGNKSCAANPGVCTNGCVCCVYSNGNNRCVPPGTCTGTVATTTTTPAPTTTTSAPTTTTTTTTTTVAPCPAGYQLINGGCFFICASHDDCPAATGCDICYFTGDTSNASCVNRVLGMNCGIGGACPTGYGCAGGFCALPTCPA